MNSDSASQARNQELYISVSRTRSRVPTLASAIRRIWNRMLLAMSIPILLSEYFDSATGREYDVGFWTKLRLGYVMARNRKRVTTGSHFLEHLLMATQILKVPKS